jgi:hypothetical protein
MYVCIVYNMMTDVYDDVYVCMCIVYMMTDVYDDVYVCVCII